MITTSARRKVLVAVCGTALSLSSLAACAESTANDPGTSPADQGTTLVEDAKKYAGDPWEQRLVKEKRGGYVGDPWEKRLRDDLRERDQ